MDIDWVRKQCLALPHVTEDVKWEKNLVFSVATKMFTVVGLEPDEFWISFKCNPQDFADLPERPGIEPAPYLARAQWVSLETRDALSSEELATQLRRAYECVFARLPKRVQRELSE
jgi:predicted DNA-binding protein (MmcQ/YjbR family)